MHNAGIQGQEDNGEPFLSSICWILLLVCPQLDCGIHPGLSGMDALPYTDMIDAEDIDLLLITQSVRG